MNTYIPTTTHSYTPNTYVFIFLYFIHINLILRTAIYYIVYANYANINPINECERGKVVIATSTSGKKKNCYLCNTRRTAYGLCRVRTYEIIQW